MGLNGVEERLDKTACCISHNVRIIANVDHGISCSSGRDTLSAS